MKEILIAVRAFFIDRFNLNEDKAEEEEIVSNIRRDVTFKGTNLWTLIFAILIASIGLNVNSTTVIIGAMLISPLMGPIMGVGLGIGINDFDLLGCFHCLPGWACRSPGRYRRFTIVINGVAATVPAACAAEAIK